MTGAAATGRIGADRVCCWFVDFVLIEIPKRRASRTVASLGSVEIEFDGRASVRPTSARVNKDVVHRLVGRTTLVLAKVAIGASGWRQARPQVRFLLHLSSPVAAAIRHRPSERFAWPGHVELVFASPAD